MTYVWRTAHSLASKGRPVFPIAPGAKTPLTTRGLHDATTDHAIIEAWERRWPPANLGIPMGHRSGLIALDLDMKDARDGLATLAELERDLGSLPRTLTARTPSGGQHRFFHMPNATIRNSAGKICGADAPGFDVRGEGGYVLTAPSVVGGRPYGWGHVAPIADLPAQWVAALARREREAPPAEQWQPRNAAHQNRAQRWCVRALQSEARELAAAPKGTRNDRLWRAAAALGGLVHIGGITAGDVRTALLWACSTWRTRTPGKDRTTLENGLRFGLENPRQIDLGDDRAA